MGSNLRRDCVHGSAADGNGNGTIDAADYVLWRSRQGQVVLAAASASLAEQC